VRGDTYRVLCAESCERTQMTGGIISQLFRGRKLRRVVAIDNHAVDAPETKRNETKPRNEAVSIPRDEISILES